MRTRNVVGVRTVTNASADSARPILNERSSSRVTNMGSELSPCCASAGDICRPKSRTPATVARDPAMHNGRFDFRTKRFLLKLGDRPARGRSARAEESVMSATSIRHGAQRCPSMLFPKPVAAPDQLRERFFQGRALAADGDIAARKPQQ